MNSDNILVKSLTDDERETRRSDSQYMCKIVDIGSAVFRQSERHKTPDDVKFVGLHINAMRTALLSRPDTLTKEDRYIPHDRGQLVPRSYEIPRSATRLSLRLEIKEIYDDVSARQ